MADTLAWGATAADAPLGTLSIDRRATRPEDIDIEISYCGVKARVSRKARVLPPIMQANCSAARIACATMVRLSIITWAVRPLPATPLSRGVLS